ncbi:hypothetical protein DAPPUDRAFT_330913 [Daphnia pulex]|uniref:Uncharacterized protein n=1 Tax=Daphnia pulex TaxID=6669 RepID=E9HKZ8_DAPPU|nr:hypothetical protein DAPPUDRAFT_330913 [Daphnia pulex]|eukprot:EFX67586.1 hypothetical protein DAPPUDRAFT_330913 [Daphnia pulex]
MRCANYLPYKKIDKLLTEETVVTEGRHYFMKTIMLFKPFSLPISFSWLVGILRGILTIGSNQNSKMGVAAINWGVSNLTPTLPTDAALLTI